MSNLTHERKVGITVLVAMGCLLLLVLFIGRTRFGFKGYPVAVVFGYVDSLKPDAPVLYGGGVKIGMVEKIEAFQGRVKVTCLIDRGARIPADSEVTINTTGILGEKYVQVNAGSPEGPAVPEKGQIEGRDPGSLDRTLQRIEAMSNLIGPLFDDKRVKDGLAGTLANANRASGELAGMLQDIRPDVTVAAKNLREISETLKKVSKDAERLAGKAEGILSDKNRANLEKSLEHLNSTLANLDKVMAKVDKKEGALGTLVYDEKLADDLREIIRDLKNHPWKLLWKK